MKDNDLAEIILGPIFVASLLVIAIVGGVLFRLSVFALTWVVFVAPLWVKAAALAPLLVKWGWVEWANRDEFKAAGIRRKANEEAIRSGKTRRYP